MSSCSSSTASAPPRHSVTSSPVNSRWTPPGHVPSPRQAREEALELGHDRVEAPRLVPAASEAVGVHRVARPDDRMARLAHGAQQRRQQRRDAARRPCARSASGGPGIRAGLSCAQSSTTSSGVAAGPSLTPSGLCTPAKNSTCAPSGWRVRSPIQSMCAEQSYQSPVSESRRVERLLVVEQEALVARPDVDLVQLVSARGRCRRRP